VRESVINFTWRINSYLKKLVLIATIPGEFFPERLSFVSSAEPIYGSHSLKGDREVEVDVTRWLLTPGKELY
jgi:hypothetical protein